MSIYAGLIILQPITNKQRYLETLNEIRHCLQSHSNEVIVDEQSKTLLTLKPRLGFAEASFPLNHLYLHTVYFRISGELNPSDDLKIFANVLWECLSIFKENFASRVDLFQENLDVCGSFIKNFSSDEILRRQISSLISKKVSNEILKKDEVDDIFAILESSIKKRNTKGIHASLELLSNKQICPKPLLTSISEKQFRLIEELVNSKPILDYAKDSEDELVFRQSESNKALAEMVYSILLQAQKEGLLPKNSEYIIGQPYNLELRTTEIPSEIDKAPVVGTQYERPTNLKTCLFQLSETNDISRVSFLLQYIIEELIDKAELLARVRFYDVVLNLINKYSNGDYGFDNTLEVKYCIFQNRLLKVLIALFKHDDRNLVNFSVEAINKISQIAEECCLYIVQNIASFDKTHDFEYNRFYELSLKVFEILLSNCKRENLLELSTALKNIEERIRMYFSQAEEEIDTYEMEVFSVELKKYYESVKKLMLKSEALGEVTNLTFKMATQTRNVVGSLVDKENLS